MEEEIIEIDKTFDFNNAYKINYCTLVNFAIAKFDLKNEVFIDGISVEIGYNKELYAVCYRDWQNPNWFKLSNPGDNRQYYFSSQVLAEKSKSKLIADSGYEFLTRKEALETAQKAIDIDKRMIKK